eukprot:212535-Chlamydomonas_euryale.AAC.1
MPEREALACLQSRALGIARVRLLPKMQGMRPIVNLGKASAARFHVRVRNGRQGGGSGGGGGGGGGGAKRCSRHQAVNLSFKPVNFVLQVGLLALWLACWVHAPRDEGLLCGLPAGYMRPVMKACASLARRFCLA